MKAANQNDLRRSHDMELILQTLGQGKLIEMNNVIKQMMLDNGFIGDKKIEAMLMGIYITGFAQGYRRKASE